MKWKDGHPARRVWYARPTLEGWAWIACAAYLAGFVTLVALLATHD
jgi:hypothetical protein